MLDVEQGKDLIQLLRSLNYNQETAANEEDAVSQLFFHARKISAATMSCPLAEKLDICFETGVLVRTNAEIYSRIRIVPFRGHYFMVDSPLTSSTSADLSNYYSNRLGSYGYIGRDGMSLASYVVEKVSTREIRKCLDLCTGSGIVGGTLSALCDSVYGTDIDPAAVEWAQFNTAVNGITNYEAILGNLYDPVDREGPFDLIVANPSYTFLPPNIVEEYQVRDHEISTDYGLELTLKILAGLDKNLAQNGRAYICTMTPVLNGKDYLLQSLRAKFSACDYFFSLHYLSKSKPKRYAQYYRDAGITRFCFVFIGVERGRRFGITQEYPMRYRVRDIPLASRVYRKVKGAAVRMRAGTDS